MYKCPTQEEFEAKLKAIKMQEEKYNVKIKFDKDCCRDKDHLDCIWYGGEVGRIIMPDGWKIVIGAYGDIRLWGKIHGEDFYLKDKNNSGDMYYDLAKTYHINDEQFYELCADYYDTFKGDDDNCIYFEDNNWFEVDLIGPDGNWVDLCGADNVLDNNILDCFADVSAYFEYVEWAEKGEI